MALKKDSNSLDNEQEKSQNEDIPLLDLNNLDNNEVFVFNGWTFFSSPSINPFEHPVYDIWLTNCY